MPPQFSIVIPCFNASRTLAKCLDSLAMLDSTNWECIFVDNNSTDTTASIIHRFIKQHPDRKFLQISEKKAGASAARNSGARHAKGDWLVFTDADCAVDSQWLQDAEFNISHHTNCAAFAGCVQAYPAENIVAKFLSMYTLQPNQREETLREFSLIRGGFPTANFFIRHDLFNSIGGFNESIPIYGEDYELCVRIYESGNVIRALTNAVVYHIHRDDAKGLFRQSFGFGRSHAYCLKMLVPGAVIVSLPFFQKICVEKGKRIWIDLNQLDKKLCFLAVTGLCFPPILLFAGLYLFYTFYSMRKRAQRKGIALSSKECCTMIWLLFMKSFSMTRGRITGSLKYRVICL